MSLERVRFDCHACGLAIEADESPDRAEPATGAYVRVAWCRNEHRALMVDVESAAFRGRCSDCGEALELVHFPPPACPRCHAPAKARHAYVGPL